MKCTLLALLLALTLTPAANAGSELNINGFATCLRATIPQIDNDGTYNRYQFGFFDLVLPYLSVYPSRRVPGVIGAVQDSARENWSGKWEPRELKLAKAFATQNIVTPGAAYQAAAGLCHAGDVFCPALLLHNVLRTFGRHDEAIATMDNDRKVDLNPKWFQRDRANWVALIPMIQAKMLSLRIDGGGDRWGEWYHLFGILAYSARGAATGQDVTSVDFVVALNELLNPLLADGAEEPHKAQIDRDTVEVSSQLLDNGRSLAPVDCSVREAYVNLAPVSSGSKQL